MRLGVTYRLCSSATSHVAIEKRETPVEGKLEPRRVLVAFMLIRFDDKSDTGMERSCARSVSRSIKSHALRLVCDKAELRKLKLSSNRIGMVALTYGWCASDRFEMQPLSGAEQALLSKFKIRERNA